MNRTQFWTLIAGSGLVVLVVILQITFTSSLRKTQEDAADAQQKIQVGNVCETRLRQLAYRVFQVSQQTQDQGLKDILVRQNIVVRPPGSGTATQSPVSAPTR